MGKKLNSDAEAVKQLKKKKSAPKKGKKTEHFTYPQKRKIGRPPKFESRAQLIKLIEEYFQNTPREQLSVTGLCLAIGTNKVTFNEYEEKEEFADVVKEAKMIVENSYELSLRKNGRTGDIFALKNFGWKDKTESDVNVSGGLSLSQLYDESEGH